MKKLMILTALSVMSVSSFSADTCQLLESQNARLNSCQNDIHRTNRDIDSMNDRLADIDRQLNPKAEKRRQELLSKCVTENKAKENKIKEIAGANKELSRKAAKISTLKGDATRESRAKLINGYECVTIDHRLGNGRADRGWGGFAGQQAIFMGAGRTQAQAQNAMIQDAASKRYFTKNASDRRKRIIKNMTCLPTYNTELAKRTLGKINDIITEANKVKLPNFPGEARSRIRANRGNRG